MRAGFDSRLTPVRPDLAASHLRGQVEAPRYADGMAMTVSVPVADLVADPAARGMESQLLLGDGFTVYDLADGWAWGQVGFDGYVGYVAEASLRPARDGRRVTIGAPFQHVYPVPDIKSRPGSTLPYLATPAAVEWLQDFVALAGGGYVLRAHLARTEPDFVTVAETFLGVPYLWGGTSVFGLDCSGLVQLALRAAGRVIGRDSDMQAAAGEAVPDGAALQRGDLICWRGHIGIMQDAMRLIHATGHAMRVISEPLDKVVERIAGQAQGGPVTARRRPG